MGRRLTHVLLLVLAIALMAGCRSGDSEGGDSSDGASSGKLIVGTSADYPPFAFHDEAGELDGFDVALAYALGDQLGREVEVRSIAFEGLLDALQVGQIEVVISAMSVTPERQGRVGFTNPYYVGEDAVLARSGADADPPRDIDDLGDRRVGVQRGSVFETDAQTLLVDTGRMPASRLVAYASAEQAVEDLRGGLVELVWLDAEPAEAFSADGDLAIIAGGLHEQRFAVGVQLGADELRESLNAALATLYEDGLLDELHREYLGREAGALPTDEPVAPVPTAEAEACLDGLALVEHVTYDHQSFSQPPKMQPGQAFDKTWRVENTGTCTWTTDHTLQFEQGNVPAARMDGEPVALAQPVAPGETADLTVPLDAPILPGTYIGFWEMHDAGDEPFGERLPVAINVISPPTPTPAPTEAPQRQVVFTADPTTINVGDGVQFTWVAEGASAVYFYRQGERWQERQVPPVGQRMAWPNNTTDYILRVAWPDGLTEEHTIRIEVIQPAQAPRIPLFSVTPDRQVQIGYCVDIRWQVTGDVDRVVLRAGDEAMTEGAPLTGSAQHCPSSLGTIRYTIEATGPGGTTSLSHDVEVVSPDGAQPTPTPLPPPGTGVPIIEVFVVSPAEIQAGQCVNISWQVGGGTESYRITRNNAVVMENGPYSGVATDCLNDRGTVRYRVEARNGSGQQAAAEQTVQVR